MIGCGEIGGPVARRLAGLCPLIACDLSESRRQLLSAAGLQVTGEIADCAGAALVFLCPATGDQVLRILRGLVRAEPVPQVVIVLSTVSPATMAEAARIAAPRGIAVIDAPVSGGAAGAEAGTLTVMAGGDAALIDRLRPVFAAFAGHVLHCGPLGSGQIAKIANNVICHVNTVLMAELLQIGLSLGLRPEAVAEVMERGTGRNYLTANPAGLAGFYRHFAGDAERFSGLAAIFRKDLGLAEALGLAASADMPGIMAVAALMRGVGSRTADAWAALAHAAAPHDP